jgi:hypothetical protein
MAERRVNGPKPRRKGSQTVFGRVRRVINAGAIQDEGSRRRTREKTMDVKSKRRLIRQPINTATQSLP